MSEDLCKKSIISILFSIMFVAPFYIFIEDIRLNLKNLSLVENNFLFTTEYQFTTRYVEYFCEYWISDEECTKKCEEIITFHESGQSFRVNCYKDKTELKISKDFCKVHQVYHYYLECYHKLESGIVLLVTYPNFFEFKTGVINGTYYNVSYTIGYMNSYGECYLSLLPNQKVFCGDFKGAFLKTQFRNTQIFHFEIKTPCVPNFHKNPLLLGVFFQDFYDLRKSFIAFLCVIGTLIIIIYPMLSWVLSSKLKSRFEFVSKGIKLFNEGLLAYGIISFAGKASLYFMADDLTVRIKMKSCSGPLFRVMNDMLDEMKSTDMQTMLNIFCYYLIATLFVLPFTEKIEMASVINGTKNLLYRITNEITPLNHVEKLGFSKQHNLFFFFCLLLIIIQLALIQVYKEYLFKLAISYGILSIIFIILTYLLSSFRKYLGLMFNAMFHSYMFALFCISFYLGNNANASFLADSIPDGDTHRSIMILSIIGLIFSWFAPLLKNSPKKDTTRVEDDNSKTFFKWLEETYKKIMEKLEEIFDKILEKLKEYFQRRCNKCKKTSEEGKKYNTKPKWDAYKESFILLVETCIEIYSSAKNHADITNAQQFLIDNQKYYRSCFNQNYDIEQILIRYSSCRLQYFILVLFPFFFYTIPNLIGILIYNCLLFEKNEENIKKHIPLKFFKKRTEFNSIAFEVLASFAKAICIGVGVLFTERYLVLDLETCVLGSNYPQIVTNYLNLRKYKDAVTGSLKWDTVLLVKGMFLIGWKLPQYFSVEEDPEESSEKEIQETQKSNQIGVEITDV